MAALSDGLNGAFGIGRVTNQAFSIGVTAMPGPVTDADWDGWLFHQFYTIRGKSTVASDLASPSGSIRFDVDSKAMRKLKADDVVFGMVEMTESGTVTSRIDFDSRVLLMLS